MFCHRIHGLGMRPGSLPPASSARRRRRLWVPESLEHRVLLSGTPTIYTVDLTSDSGRGSGLAGDLLYCITQADASDSSAGSLIEFDPNVFASPQTITLASTLVLSERDGPEVIGFPAPSSVVTISGNNAVQVFSIDAGVTATLAGLTISGGMTSQDGGGISNAGMLTITECNISGNSTATGGGGGGAGVYNSGTLTITGSTITGNTATPKDFNDGGGIFSSGTLTVSACDVSGNSANDGGGIFDINDELTISDTFFSHNSASVELNDDSASGGIGGGVYDFGGKGMTVAGSIFSDNTAGGGGGIDVYECPLAITGTTLSSNTTAGDGGGINNYSSVVTIADSTLSSNTAGNFGGGFYDDGGTDTFTNSTVSGNSATTGGGILFLGTTLLVVNCTIAYNDVATPGQGGGLGIGTGTATLDNTIVAQNIDGTANDGSADDLSNYDGFFGQSALSTASANNLIGIGGAGLLTNGTNGNLVGFGDSGLGALGFNGGPTETIALESDSPAIGAGSDALAASSDQTTDEHGAGFARSVSGSTVDIGAFQTGDPTGYLVNLTSDSGAGSDGAGDLLYCVTQANANANSAGSLIEFAPTIFNADTPQTITLSDTLALEETAGAEVLAGPGAGAVTISGNNAVQVFDASQANVTASLTGVTIADGMTGPGGAGIDNDGTLTVAGCTFTSDTSFGEGGAITNSGKLTVASSTISDNTAALGGGIYNEGMLTVTGSTILGNAALIAGGYGGGIDNADGGTLDITSTTIKQNSAVHGGGAIFNEGSSTLTVTDSVISVNSAATGGGVDNDTSTLAVTESILSGNESTGTSSNAGGGGIADSGGSASITASTLWDNTAAGGGGGILMSGGAIAITDSKLSSNSAAGAQGGVVGVDSDSGTLTVTNSTIAGNSAERIGAGIDENGGTLTSVNCTIAYNNVASDGQGGGVYVDVGTAILDNTIIVLNTDGTGGVAPADDIDVSSDGGVSSTSAFNLIGTGTNDGLTTANHNQLNVANPGLGALADNGGPTETIALLAGSPALGAGSAALAVDAKGQPLLTDQRGAGFPRMANGSVDVGAFEHLLVVTTPTVYTVDLTSDTGAGREARATCSTLSIWPMPIRIRAAARSSSTRQSSAHRKRSLWPAPLSYPKRWGRR